MIFSLILLQTIPQNTMLYTVATFKSRNPEFKHITNKHIEIYKSVLLYIQKYYPEISLGIFDFNKDNDVRDFFAFIVFFENKVDNLKEIMQFVENLKQYIGMRSQTEDIVSNFIENTKVSYSNDFIEKVFFNILKVHVWVMIEISKEFPTLKKIPEATLAKAHDYLKKVLPSSKGDFLIIEIPHEKVVFTKDAIIEEFKKLNTIDEIIKKAEKDGYQKTHIQDRPLQFPDPEVQSALEKSSKNKSIEVIEKTITHEGKEMRLILLTFAAISSETLEPPEGLANQVAVTQLSYKYVRPFLAAAKSSTKMSIE